MAITMPTFDREEKEGLVREITSGLTEVLLHYVNGEGNFADATFAMNDALEDVHAIATNDYQFGEDEEAPAYG